MKRALWSMASLLALLSGACRANPPAGDVRPPAVAGKFYPADPAKLRGAIEGFLADAVPSRGERPLAIVAPHAGYVFSGQIAADAWRQVQGHEVDTVVILGTNHTVAPFHGVSVSSLPGYRTPLGVAVVDRELGLALHRACSRVLFKPAAHETEHSEEVQIPFVQVLFPRARILPCVLGTTDPALVADFGKALAKVLEGRKTLIVASSDLSHYPAYADAVRSDARVLRAAASMDPAALREALKPALGLDTCACGEGPILAAMTAAKALGACRGVVLAYANSGDGIFGDPDKVVGYGAVMYTAGQGASDVSVLDARSAQDPVALSAQDKAALLKLARTTLERYFATDTVPLPRPGSRRRGAFVTLTKGGELRGCIGHMAEDTPLALTVARMALQAALKDPRFPPVTPGEVPRLHLEVSALTPMERIPGFADIVVGRDGVMLEKDGRRAVFLPQVAPEQGWNRDQMLGQLCLKAGLPAQAWRTDCRFWTFRADVFGETPSR